MALTSEQIEQARSVIGGISYDVAATLLSSLNSVQESEVALDLAEFAKYKNKFTKISIDGVEIDPSLARLAIRNRLRDRVNLLPLESETDVFGSGIHSFEYSHPAN